MFNRVNDILSGRILGVLRVDHNVLCAVVAGIVPISLTIGFALAWDTKHRIVLGLVYSVAIGMMILWGM